jgi:hypothetical protein
VTRGQRFAISDKRAPVYTMPLVRHIFGLGPHKDQIFLGEHLRGVCRSSPGLYRIQLVGSCGKVILHKIRTLLRRGSNTHIAFRYASPLRSHLSESTTKGCLETKTGRRYQLDGGVCQWGLWACVGKSDDESAVEQGNSRL